MDKIFSSWLRTTSRDAIELASASDLLDLYRIDPQRFLARFSCRGLVRDGGGEVREADRFEVGFWFPDDYLRRADPYQVVSWIRPIAAFHPNVAPPLCCVGSIAPGTQLADLLHRTFDLIAYQNFTADENDALNRHACQWARNNRHRFPVDDRPIKRRPRAAAPEPLR